MTRQENQDIPEGFTLSLALVDAVPVALFCACAAVLGTRVGNPLFMTGAVLAATGGAGKVAWKLVMALAHKNVLWLGRQMRATMPVGFALMLVGAAAAGIGPSDVTAAVTCWPACAFFLGWLVCMLLMGWFATHNDQADAHSNWVEQLVNAAGQACLLVGLLLT